MLDECVLADGTCDYWPTYRPDPHHVVPQQTIRGQYTYWHSLTEQTRLERGLPETLPLQEQALLDRRNIVPLCRAHHDRVTSHAIYVPADCWPDGIYDFAAEVGVTWWLERWSTAA